ncbi:NAD-dependent deacetylase hst3 [Coemansia sp. RSA 1878]|nr:NAD-dependent deacetylase hst3 [Coemansia sp. RSA 1878]
MPETLWLSEGGEEIQKLVKRVASARRVVVVTGAGISVNCGIPDFRSSSGLFKQIQASHGDVVSKGRDLFDASVVFRTAQATRIFYEWMTHLREQCERAQPGVVHAFIRQLADRGQLQRSYTQNIDGLERKAGLEVWDPHCPTTSPECVPWQQAQSIPLHGTMDRLTCQLCSSSDTYNAVAGDSCSDCMSRSQQREQLGRRALATGTLRPAVVLYGEPHPHSEDIARIIGHDTRALQGRKRATHDVLLVLGTTLKVPGCKQLVRQLAAAPTTTTIVVNNEHVCGRVWDNIVDYQIIGCVDDWCSRVQRVWAAQTKITQWTRVRKTLPANCSAKGQKVTGERRSTTKKENVNYVVDETVESQTRKVDHVVVEIVQSQKRRAQDNDSIECTQPEPKRRRAELPMRRSARIAMRESIELYHQSLSICT